MGRTAGNVGDGKQRVSIATGSIIRVIYALPDGAKTGIPYPLAWVIFRGTVGDAE